MVFIIHMIFKKCVKKIIFQKSTNCQQITRYLYKTADIYCSTCMAFAVYVLKIHLYVVLA